MTILWVENHARFAHLAGREFLGAHDVTVVPSLAQAREVLAARRFDAVLLDFDLDDGKGVELVPQLVGLEPRPLIVAASAFEEKNALLISAGADAACHKTRFANISAVLDAAR